MIVVPSSDRLHNYSFAILQSFPSIPRRRGKIWSGHEITIAGSELLCIDTVLLMLLKTEEKEKRSRDDMANLC